MWSWVLTLALCFSLPAATLDERIATAFGSGAGCAVVIDVKSGRLIAAHRLDMAARTLTHPGSTIKPFTIAALLDRGRMAASDTLHCRRTLTLLGRDMSCSHDPAIVRVTPADAIAHSCNSAVTQAARRLSSEELANALRSYGLASRTMLAVDEASGEIRVAVDEQHRQLQAIGEEDILVTPLGLAMAYVQLARRAHDERVAPVFAGLRNAVTSGTAQLANSSSIEISGKTGTTLTMDGSRRQAWFAGFAPAKDPKIAFVVLVPQGSGAANAAPVARKVVESWAAR